MPKQCQKCKAWSGDDWSRCEGKCPVPGSPHYDVGTAALFPKRQPEEVVRDRR